jgi:hypothetical protein
MQGRLHLEDIRKGYGAAGYSWDDPPAARTLDAVMQDLRTGAQVQPGKKLPPVGIRKAPRRLSAMVRAGGDDLPSPYRGRKTLITTKDWTLENILSRGTNIEPVDRVASDHSCLEAQIREHERGGLPLIIEGVHHHRRWNARLLTAESFQALSAGEFALLCLPFLSNC